MASCQIPEGCDRPHYAKGACRSHYQSRWLRLGSLELPDPATWKSTRPAPLEYPPGMACSLPVQHGPNKGRPATGTVTGYDRHKKQGEPACDDCKRAVADYQASRPTATVGRDRGKKERTKRHKRVIDAIKSSRPCTDCRIHFPSFVLDFDHVPERGTKEKDISDLPSYSLSVILDELDKCEVVCANCHRLRTADRGRWELDFLSAQNPRNAQVLIDAKSSGCLDCGMTEYYALEFDHLPGQPKLATISAMRFSPTDKLKAEIAKCDVVCANCHRVRTARRAA